MLVGPDTLSWLSVVLITDAQTAQRFPLPRSGRPGRAGSLKTCVRFSLVADFGQNQDFHRVRRRGRMLRVVGFLFTK